MLAVNSWSALLCFLNRLKVVKYMQEENKGDKIGRVLQLYAKLSDGYVINKAEEAA